MGPAKLTEVSLEGDFKNSITRKRWLGRHIEGKEESRPASSRRIDLRFPSTPYVSNCRNKSQEKKAIGKRQKRDFQVLTFEEKQEIAKAWTLLPTPHYFLRFFMHVFAF